MPDHTDDPEFEFPEGVVPRRPADEATDDPMDYFNQDEDDAEDPEAMVPGGIAEEPEIIAPTGPRGAKPKSRKPLIVTAVVCVAAALVGGGYWHFFDGGGDPRPPVDDGKKVVDPDLPSSETNVVQIVDASTKTTSELLEMPIAEQMKPGDLPPASLEELLKRAESGELDRPTYDKFIKWTKENAGEIGKDQELKTRVDSCVEGLRYLFDDEGSAVMRVPSENSRPYGHERLPIGKSRIEFYAQSIQLFLWGVQPGRAFVTSVMFSDPVTEPTDRNRFEDDSVPFLVRLKIAESLIASYRKTDRAAAGMVCDQAIEILRGQVNRINDEIPGLMQTATSNPTTERISEEITHKRASRTMLQSKELRFLQLRAELLTPSTSASRTVGEINAQLAKISFSNEAIDDLMLPDSASVGNKQEFDNVTESVRIAAAEIKSKTTGKVDDLTVSEENSDVVTDDLETIRQGWFELKLRIQIANSIEDLNLPAELSGLATEQEVEQLDEPQLGEKATQSEKDEFNAARRYVGMARVEMERIIENKPADSFLTTEDAANAMTQLQIIRTGWSQMRVMTLMVANRAEPQAGVVLTPGQIKATLDGLEIPADPVPDLLPGQKENFDEARETAMSGRQAILDALTETDQPDDKPLPFDIVSQLTTQIERFRSAYFQMQATRLVGSGGGDTLSIVITSVTKPSEVRAVLTGLGMPDAPNSFQLGANASDSDKTAFTSLKTKVLVEFGNIEAQLPKPKDPPEAQSADNILPATSLTQITTSLESIRLGLVEMAARVAVSNLDPGSPPGSPSGPTLARQRLKEFLTAIDLPKRLDHVKPPEKKPEVLSDTQFKSQQADWSVLTSDVAALQKLVGPSDLRNSAALSEAEIQDATTRMDRVLVNLLKLDASSQIAALNFPLGSSRLGPARFQGPAGPQEPGALPGSSGPLGQQGAQMAMNGICVPSWITTDDELSNVIDQLRQEIYQTTVNSAAFVPGPTADQVQQVVFQETQGIRQEFQQEIDKALTRPRTLVPEQLETVAESTAARVMDILSAESLPPFTLPPVPTAVSGSSLERGKAVGEFRQGHAQFFSNFADANFKAMNHFSVAARLDPRRPVYRYFLALSLRRDGQSVEAARQARIGASLESQQNRAQVSEALQHVQGDSRTWLERFRISPKN